MKVWGSSRRKSLEVVEKFEALLALGRCWPKTNLEKKHGKIWPSEILVDRGDERRCAIVVILTLKQSSSSSLPFFVVSF